MNVEIPLITMRYHMYLRMRFALKVFLTLYLFVTRQFRSYFVRWWRRKIWLWRWNVLAVSLKNFIQLTTDQTDALTCIMRCYHSICSYSLSTGRTTGMAEHINLHDRHSDGECRNFVIARCFAVDIRTYLGRL